MISEAEKDATKLREAAGANFEPLVEAISAYGKARDGNDQAAADEALAGIVALLESASGEVAGILTAARAQANADLNRIRAQANEFQKLLPEFRKNPQIVLAQKWQPILLKVLSNENQEVEKYYLPKGVQIMVKTGRTPEFMRKQELKRLERPETP